MLRIYFLQHWFTLSDPAVDFVRPGSGVCPTRQWNLSDPAVEEALYDSQAMRHFVGIDLGCGRSG
jgi:IS5 family transposase